MASFRIGGGDDEDDTLELSPDCEVKRSFAHEDQYNKVLSRPFIAPSASEHSILDHAGNKSDEAQTWHHDYNFDEKDYKNRRKESTKYHEPLRRISTHRSDLSKDKKSLKRHKKHKRDNERESRLSQLLSHEDVKVESRRKSGHHPHHSWRTGVVAPVDLLDRKEETSVVINASDKGDIKNESELIPSLAAREDDTIEEAKPIPSPSSLPKTDTTEPQSFELQDIKVEIPIETDDEVNGEIKVPSLLSREEADETDALVAMPSLRARDSDVQPAPEPQPELVKDTEQKIYTPDEKELVDSSSTPQDAETPFQTPTAFKAVSTPNDEPISTIKDTAKDEEDYYDDGVGLQMGNIKRDQELPSGKPLKKFITKDRDSYIDILPKIQEHGESTDEPVSIVISDYEIAHKGEKAKEEQLDIESHHRDKDRLAPDVIRKGHKRHHRRHHHKKHEIKQHRTISEREALAAKTQIRSGLKTLQETEAHYLEHLKRKGSLEGEEELEKKDLEEIAWHRFEDLRGLRRRRPHLRKPKLKSGTLTRQSSTDTLTASVVKFPVKYDHTPHEPFIELQELTHKDDGMVWRETARWIKFEEDVEASNRWGRPHVASLTFQSLLELRKGLEKGTVLLDLEQFDIHSIVETIVENMVITDQLPRSEKDTVVDALLLKHRHQYQEEASIPRRPSFYNLKSFSQNVSKEDENHFPEQPDALKQEDGAICLKIDDSAGSDTDEEDHQKSHMPLYSVSDDEENQSPKREVTFAPPRSEEKVSKKIESNVKSRIPADAEATSVMVGTLNQLERPVLAFVRLAKGVELDGLTEVDIPCRFIFIMLGPSDKEDTYYEIGRSISTLMSDQVFHDLAYYSESREDVLHAINEFLDDTIVLPPGEWDRQLLIPLLMGQSKVMAKRRKEAKQINAIAVAAAEEQEGPLQRTGQYCGGLIRDIKRRAEYYISDFKDGFNLHSLWVILFLYFAVFAPNIAFGGLLADKTDNWLGISEVIFATCLCGILFGLFSGQPLIIIGATGPVLVFEQSIFQFCKSYGIEFLPWRFWIGVWVMIILFIVVLFEGCFLVRYFTRFTEEVFGCLISTIFIYEALSYMYKVFKANPISRQYLNGTKITVESGIIKADREPNTALMTVILLFGTFCVAFYMQKVRHSHFFGKQTRRLISDLGIIIAMGTMTILDVAVGDKVITDKVSYGNPFTVGFRPTKYQERGWVINPVGLVKTIHPGLPFAAVIPALFIGILLFMETELTGVLLNKKENNLQKIPGFNIDLVVMGVLTFICGLFGLPWMCAATVRSISHFTALSVWSTSHAPGERPFLVDVKEQRVTNIAIHVLTGISIMLAPLIHTIPVPVVFGVLLYLGVASLSHIQLVNRIVMLFMAPKHHPDVRYVRKVHTTRIHWFTGIQVVCLIILMIVKLTSVAPAFPFFIICLIPVRRFLANIFTKEELEELDNEEGDESDDDDLDVLMLR